MEDILLIDKNDEYMMSQIHDLNDSYLEMFRLDLAGLPLQEIGSHLLAADGFINDFLLRGLGVSMEAGPEKIGEYFGYDYIVGYLWSTPETLKADLSSVELFYASMAKRDIVKKESLDILRDAAEMHIEEWQDLCRRFNNPAEDNPFAE